LWQTRERRAPACRTTATVAWCAGLLPGQQLPFRIPTYGPGAAATARRTPAPDMDSTTPRIDVEDTPAGQRLLARGAWTAADLTSQPTWEAITAQLHEIPPMPQRDGAWDLRSIDRLDFLGAQVLWNHWGHKLPDGLQADEGQLAIFQTIEQFALAPPVPPQRGPGWQALFMLLGSRLLGFFDHVRGLVRLVGQLALDVLRLVRRPQFGPWRDLSGHLFNMGATALPITALVGFLIGVVLAYLISQQLRQFGADAFIVDILGISLIRELGPVLTAILIAGRTGSAITAQIGVMRVTEELDAMRVMGIPRGFRLVMPRALALAVVMPLISVWTTLAALLGGMLAADVAMGITPSYFINSLPAAVNVANLTLATAKSVVFGLLIALVGCHYGLRVRPNTESLGQGTTSSVVTSITVVILVDALFAILFRNVGT
jgi:phospholipid/cholesterol/gamma-HCH transport system permease protein